MSEGRNLFLAIAVSISIMFGWKVIYERYFFVKPAVVSSSVVAVEDVVAPSVDVYKTREQSLRATANDRVAIKGRRISGSFLLKGAVFDDLSLLDYHPEVDDKESNVTLLAPSDVRNAYFIEKGWMSPDHSVVVPDSRTIWKLDATKINKSDDFYVVWDNGHGVVFREHISVDDDYMFKVEQEVENRQDKSIFLVPFGRIKRMRDDSKSYFISHEGAVGVVNGAFQEWKYKDITSTSMSANMITREGNGWLGFSDKYWFAALIPEGIRDDVSVNLSRTQSGSRTAYQIEYSGSYVEVQSASNYVLGGHLFVGAKELNVLDRYRSVYGISLFDKAVDFGLLYFLTKPVFLLLDSLNNFVKNFGVAVILMTIIVKVVLMPWSLKSSLSMLKIKSLQPEIEKIKERYKNDKMRMSKEMSVLFKKVGVSPLSGILPVLLQLPVFFALYKVLFVTIEMRHAPFIWWIKDLSSADTTNVLNLFGLLPFNPSFHLGILPIILGLTMLLQQKMQESQITEEQRNMMRFLPYVFTLVFASFPTGLILYWICNNIITMVQQFFIKYIFERRGGLSSGVREVNGVR